MEAWSSLSPLGCSNRMHWADDFDNPPKSGRIIRQRLMKRLDEAPPDSGFRSAAFWPDYVRRKPAARLALGDCGGLGVDGWLCRHAGAQQACQAAIVEHDLYRHALHDLGEIAGRVVGRQQCEFETACRREAVDMALEHGAPEAVDLDFDRLTVADMRELGFLEIRHHIDGVERNHRHQLRAG